MAEFNGIINIYKEKGFTSHDVVAVVRKILGNVKAGHTGTLDPAAEGVLPVCVGAATKISEYLAAKVKGYQAVVNLGFTTDTEDETGTILTEKPVDFNEDKIKEVVMSFLGEYTQMPPMYSAIKVNGKKLYELAREGIIIERKTRDVEIFEIRIMDFFPESNKLSIETLCSKGTYIRSLCSDIGSKMGCGANMGSLLRTRSGNFYLKDSIKLDKLKELAQQGKAEEVIIPIDKAMPECKRVFVSGHADKYLHNGNKINTKYVINQKKPLEPEDWALAYDSTKRLCGLYTVVLEGEAKMLKPTAMFMSGQERVREPECVSGEGQK